QRMCIPVRRRPPSYTLFPYTTLFRSGRGALRRRRRASLLSAACDRLGRGAGGAGARGGARASQAEGRNRTAVRRVCQRSLLPRSDRKSTRLNSSHVKISYAVFCLKKK